MGVNAAASPLTFVIGASLGALGGALASPTTSLVPGIGAEMMVLSFAVVATAGLGQIGGAAIAALLIGLARSFAVYLAPELEVLVPYLIMVLVLLVGRRACSPCRGEAERSDAPAARFADRCCCAGRRALPLVVPWLKTP